MGIRRGRSSPPGRLVKERTAAKTQSIKKVVKDMKPIAMFAVSALVLSATSFVTPVMADEGGIAAIFGTAVAGDELGDSRAKGPDASSEANATLDNSGSIGGNNSGFIGIDGNALQNAQGVFGIVQNSGNGVIIQQQLTISIKMN
jgi:hypothetical protein